MSTSRFLYLNVWKQKTTVVFKITVKASYSNNVLVYVIKSF